MEINVILYGIAKDIIGSSSYKLTVSRNISVSDFLMELKNKFPKLTQLTSLLVAVNDEYAKMDYSIKENDEVVIIPPVSGG